MAGFLGGSYARAEADRFSDIDLCVIARDDAFADVVAARAGIVRRLGRPLFVEDFGLTDIVFFVLEDGTEGEIFFGSAGRLGDVEAGRYRPLFDPDGLLSGVTFLDEGVDAADQAIELHRALTWFWHELSHFIAAVGRDQRWWAAGQLEALRRHCVNLVRIDHGLWAGDEPYEKLDRAVPADSLTWLGLTFVPPAAGEMVRAATELVRLHADLGRLVARRHGVEYPTELAAIMTRRLEDVATSSS